MKHKETSKKKMKMNHSDVSGEKNPMFGKVHTEDAKMRIAASRRNSKWLYDPLTGMQKAIDKSLVEEYLRKGWKLGRRKYQKEPGYLLSF